MAIVLHSNGIIEDFKAKDMVFSDKELLDVFAKYKDIRTLRLIEVPNSWCVWGHNEEDKDIEYSRIGSGVVGETIFSPVILIHDGELNPSWNLNEPIILNSYKEFKNEILLYIENVAGQITESENPKGPLDNRNENIFLSPLGPTKDKKILFEFDQHQQSDNFMVSKNLNQFTNKVMDYWGKFFTENLAVANNTCIIYADIKIVVTVNDKNVNLLMSTFLNHYEKDEKYEKCALVKKYDKDWKAYIAKDKKADNLPASKENQTEEDDGKK